MDYVELKQRNNADLFQKFKLLPIYNMKVGNPNLKFQKGIAFIVSIKYNKEKRIDVRSCRSRDIKPASIGRDGDLKPVPIAE